MKPWDHPDDLLERIAELDSTVDQLKEALKVQSEKTITVCQATHLAIIEKRQAEEELAKVKQELKELGCIGICRVCGNPCQTTGDVLPDLWFCAKCGGEAWSHIIEAKMQSEAELAKTLRIMREGGCRDCDDLAEEHASVCIDLEETRQSLHDCALEVEELKAENRELQLDLKNVLKKRDLCETRRGQAETDVENLTAWMNFAREQMSDAALREVDRRYMVRNCKEMP
jgi:hypothetical protein